MFTALLKQSLTAAYFGTSETMDAYLVAITVVGLLQVLVSNPIKQSLIPMFRHDLVQRGERAAWGAVSSLLNNLVVVLLFIVVLGWFSAPYIAGLIAPGFGDESRGLAASLVRIMMLGLIFFGIGTLLSQILFSYQRFLLPGLMGGAQNLVIVLSLVALGGTYGIYGLAIGIVLGAFTYFALQLPIIWKKRNFYSSRVNVRDPGTIEMGKLSFPILISVGGKEVARSTDRIFASMLPVGSLSALSYAYGLIAFLRNLFIGTAQESTFPHFTKLSAEQKFEILSRQLFQYIRLAFFITLPVAIGAMVLAESIVKVVYQRGAFDETSVRLTSLALMVYAIGFPGASMSAILNRTFFSLKDTWTPTKVALVSIGIKIILCWLLIEPLAHVGIALADSLSQIVNAVLLFCCLPDGVRGHEGWRTAKSIGQTLTAAILMGGVVYFSKEKLSGLLTVPLELSALVVLGVTAYGIVAFVIQRKDLQSLLGAVKTSLSKAGRPNTSQTIS
jgi:putative peptidoglycan lipid II flippase